MLSKQITKIIQNLEKKKFREKYNLFKIEGSKLVNELLLSQLEIESMFAYPSWIQTHQVILHGKKYVEVSEQEMKSISNFQSLPEVIALAKIPQYRFTETNIKGKLSIALNGIQDPGNLGTILRVADWFGIHNILCDKDCASIYNPKCVQASMGAIFRVKTYYVNLLETIKSLKSIDYPIFGTFLDGTNIYTTSLSPIGLIVMGNEGKGINNDIKYLTDIRLTIPSFANSDQSTESLNVGVATGIILSEFKRRIY